MTAISKTIIRFPAVAAGLNNFVHVVSVSDTYTISMLFQCQSETLSQKALRVPRGDIPLSVPWIQKSRRITSGSPICHVFYHEPVLLLFISLFHFLPVLRDYLPGPNRKGPEERIQLYMASLKEINTL